MVNILSDSHWRYVSDDTHTFFDITCTCTYKKRPCVTHKKRYNLNDFNIVLNYTFNILNYIYSIDYISTCTCTYIHTYIHTYLHTYTHASMRSYELIKLIQRQCNKTHTPTG